MVMHDHGEPVEGLMIAEELPRADQLNGAEIPQDMTEAFGAMAVADSAILYEGLEAPADDTKDRNLVAFADRVGLDERGVEMLRGMLRDLPHGEWFRLGVVDVPGYEQRQDAGYAKKVRLELARILEEAGLLVHNGKLRGGSKFSISRSAVQVLGLPDFVSKQAVTERPIYPKQPVNEKDSPLVGKNPSRAQRLKEHIRQRRIVREEAENRGAIAFKAQNVDSRARVSHWYHDVESNTGADVTNPIVAFITEGTEYEEDDLRASVIRRALSGLAGTDIILGSDAAMGRYKSVQELYARIQEEVASGLGDSALQEELQSVDDDQSKVERSVEIRDWKTITIQLNHEDTVEFIKIYEDVLDRQMTVIGLNDRGIRMVKAMISQQPTGKWFRNQDIKLATSDFGTKSARSQAYTRLMTALQSIGLVVHNGVSRGGSKHALNADYFFRHGLIKREKPVYPSTKEANAVALAGLYNLCGENPAAAFILFGEAFNEADVTLDQLFQAHTEFTASSALEQSPATQEALRSVRDLIRERISRSVAAQLLLGDREPGMFMQFGNCKGVEADLFYPERGASTKEAKQVCRGCVVREECLEYALMNGEKFGIWGGLSERERRRIRRQRSLARIAQKARTASSETHVAPPEASQVDDEDDDDLDGEAI